MPFDTILKNKMHFYKEPWNISDKDINEWAYWYFEEIIKKVNTPNPDKTMTIGPS